jgi:hypothetical protein
MCEWPCNLYVTVRGAMNLHGNEPDAASNLAVCVGSTLSGISCLWNCVLVLYFFFFTCRQQSKWPTVERAQTLIKEIYTTQLRKTTHKQHKLETVISFVFSSSKYVLKPSKLYGSRGSLFSIVTSLQAGDSGFESLTSNRFSVLRNVQTALGPIQPHI